MSGVTHHGTSDGSQNGTHDRTDDETHDDAADRGHDEAAGHDSGQGAGERLDRVRDSALRIIAEVPRAPSALHVRSGDASVDIDWPVDGPVAGPELPAVVLDAAAEVLELACPAPTGGYLTAQTVGVFYPCPEPGAAPFVTEGDVVEEGQQVAIIEAMKLMIPVSADRVGRIVEVLKANADPVEYGDRLFGLDAERTGSDDQHVLDEAR